MISNVNNQQQSSLNGFEATTSDSSASPTITKNSFSSDGASNFKNFFTKSPVSLYLCFVSVECKLLPNIHLIIITIDVRKQQYQRRSVHEWQLL